jgi:hypothetical protein
MNHLNSNAARSAAWLALALSLAGGALVTLGGCAARGRPAPSGDALDESRSDAARPGSGREIVLGGNGGRSGPAGGAEHGSGAGGGSSGVAGASSPSPAPVATPVSPETASALEAWRPAWWREGGTREGGELSVCSMATGRDLAAVRRQAVDLGWVSLRGMVPAGAEPVPTTKVDVIQLGDGQFRAFVLLRMKEGQTLPR